MTDILKRPGVIELSEMLDKGAVSSLEITEQALRDIAQHSYLNAFVALDEEGALMSARKADERIARSQRLGIIDGLPIGIKDIIDCAGLPTTYACEQFKSNLAQRDASAVSRLRQAGAVLIGKTNTHQIAMGCTGDRGCFGPTLNPHDISRMTGGSSSGSAAAVADGLVPATLGSDTGGSIRIPSALCGTVGLKPSRGRVSLHGALEVWPQSDYIGPICRSVRDCAAILEDIEGHDSNDRISVICSPSKSLKACEDTVDGFKIGVPMSAIERDCQTDVMRGIKDCCVLLNEGRADIDYFEWPDFSVYRAAQKLILHTECLYRHADDFEAHRDLYDDEVVERLRNGVSANIKTEDAYELIDEFQKLFRGLVGGFDALLLPSVCVTAPKLQERFVTLNGKREQIYEPFTGYLWQASVAGLPALAMPTGLSNGLPIGLQLVGGYCCESTVCNIGGYLEKALGLCY